MLIDSHSHMFDKRFKNDIEICIENAIKNNIKKIILVGYNDYSNNKCLEFAKKNDIFENTAGLHPSDVKQNYLEELNLLKLFIEKNKVCAIGECGLDYYHSKEFVKEQKEAFIFQIELAIKHNLPLVIHMRDATEDTYDILKEYKGKIRGVMHCYSSSYEMAKEFIKLGLYISLAGPVTYKNAVNQRLVAKNIPLESLLIETDCPYLAPQTYRGKRNESAYVKYVCEEIALIKEVSFDLVAKVTSENTIKLFNLEVK